MELSENFSVYIKDSTGIIVSFVQTILLIIFCYYSNHKICNKRIENKKKFIIDIIFMTLVAILYIVIKSSVNHLIGITVLVFLIAIIFSKSNIGKSIVTTILSISMNYILSLVSFIISYTICWSLKINNDYANMFIIEILHFAMLIGIFKIRKFKKGISFFKKDEHNDILILNISVTLLFLTVIMVNSDVHFIMNSLPVVLLFGVIMYITIQKSLQLYYKQKLLVQELNETKAELEKKVQEVEELEAENLSFSKKSHTLAHKQKSLEFKLQELLTKAEISKEEAAEVRDRIKEIEKDLYKEKTVIELDKTGIVEIDDMLKYMQSECNANKIEFELQLKGNIHYMTNNLIDKKDLETLLADHIKNAIIAINHTENVNKSILVRLGKIDETYGLYIYDSGIEFKPETLENLGKKPSTTHADEGGTGMGFMNTFDTLRKCNASLTIEEYNEPSKENYTKAIMIKFDGKNEFKIKSYRENHLSYPQKVI